MQLDNTDRKLLDLMQTAFPLSRTPWADLASELDVVEDEVLRRVTRMIDDGILRRVGAVIDARTFGYTSCLLAMRVPEERLEEVASIIGQCPNVTHNYERDDDFNLWFTLTAESEEARDAQIRIWEETIGLTVSCFPGIKTYKRRVQFAMRKEAAE